MEIIIYQDEKRVKNIIKQLYSLNDWMFRVTFYMASSMTILYNGGTNNLYPVIDLAKALNATIKKYTADGVEIISYDIDENGEEQEEQSTEREIIDFYDDIPNEYIVFSNFAMIPVKIDGQLWPSSEHYYHAMKVEDPWYQDIIRQASTGAKSKQLGNQAKGRYDEKNFLSSSNRALIKDLVTESKKRGIKLRADWDMIKDQVMYNVVKAKIEQYPQLKKLLLHTDNNIIREGSLTDEYWGTGKSGNGRNKLGITLMKIREELRGRRLTIEEIQKQYNSTLPPPPKSERDKHEAKKLLNRLVKQLTV